MIRAFPVYRPRIFRLDRPPPPWYHSSHEQQAIEPVIIRPDDIHRLLGWRYRVVRELGGGGTAAVFLADDLLAGSPVVLKASPDIPSLVRECILLHRHSHPGLVAVRDLHRFPDLAVLATEHCPGQAIGSQRLAPGQLMAVWSGLAGTLSHLHRAGIVHGDLKPEHVLVEGESARLIDLGMSVRGGETDRGGFRGTMAFAAPELLAGQGGPSPRADVYALGLVIWHALGLRPPAPAEVLDPDAAWCAAPGPALDPRTAEILTRMLRFAPEARFADAGRVTEALAHAGWGRTGCGWCEPPFTGRGEEIKKALAAVRSGTPLTLVAGSGGGRFLRELRFILQLEGRACLLLEAPAADSVPWSAVPAGAVVLVSGGIADARAIRRQLPAASVLIAQASDRAPDGPDVIRLGPLASGELGRLVERAFPGVPARDAAAMARLLFELTAGDAGAVAAGLGMYRERGWIEPASDGWRFDWPAIHADRKLPAPGGADWEARVRSLLAGAERARDAEAILHFGTVLLGSGRLSPEETLTTGAGLLRLSARMGRARQAGRLWSLLSDVPGLGWETALEAGRYLARVGCREEALAAMDLARRTAGPGAERRLGVCRAGIGSRPGAGREYPPELLEAVAAGGAGDLSAAEAGEDLSHLALQMNDWTRMACWARLSVQRYREAGRTDALGPALLLLSYALWHSQQADEAEAALVECLRLLDDGLPAALLSAAREQMALVKIARRQWDEAGRWLDLAYQELPRPVPPQNQAYLIAMQGVVHSGQGHHQLVVRCQVEAAALYLEAGDHANHAICLANAAMEHHLLGNAAAAAAMLERSLHGSRACDSPHAELIALKDLCRVSLDSGRPAEARRWFEQALALSRERPMALAPEFLACGALAAAALGNREAAADALRLIGPGADGAEGCWRDLADGEVRARLDRDPSGIAAIASAAGRFLELGRELDAAEAWLRAAAVEMSHGQPAAPERLIADLARAEAVFQRHQAPARLAAVRGQMLEAARQLKGAAGRPAADPGLLDGIYELTGLLASATEPAAIAGAAVSLAVRLLDAERGGLFLLDERSRLALVAQVNLDPDTRRDALDFSREAVLAAAGTGREIVSNDAQLDEAFSSRLSVQRNAIRSLVAAPVCFREGAAGALYLDTRLKSGAFSPGRRDFLRALAAIIGSVLESGRLLERLRRENRELRSDRTPALDRIIGRSPAVREMLGRVRTAAAADVRVLMEGETGTGKELAARAIHELSTRGDRTFLALDCGSLPENLLEAELFGSVKGAFTGAYADKTGLFEAAGGGTLFLDEVNSASPGVQARLLRAIEAGEIRRVGDTEPRPVDVRLICASNRDLEIEINEGRFREDLYYRLNVLRLRVPPLRERAGDIMLLAEHFRQQFQRQHKRRGLRFSDGARECLLHYVWPGNIRELEHVVRRAVIMAEGTEIRPSDLEIQEEALPVTTIRQEVDHVRKVKVIEALRIDDGNITYAARRLRISRRQLQRLMKRYGIDGN